MREKKRTSEVQAKKQEIDRDDDISQMLLWSMREPFEQYEKELEENPKTRDIKPPDELFSRIVNNLKEEGEWDRERETDVPDIYHMLSKKDREALELGRKITRINRTTIFMKRAAIAACVAICIFGVSMTSGANRQYVVALWNGIVGNSQLRIKVNVQDEKDSQVGKISVEEAMKNINEELGIRSIELVYKPKGMIFSSYKIEKEDERATIFYEYKEALFSIVMKKKDSKSKYSQDFDGVVVDEISIRISNDKVKIWKISNQEKNYAAYLEGEDAYYIVRGAMDQDEFKKILEGITVFL